MLQFNSCTVYSKDGSTIALSENYRSETIGRSDCHPIVGLSADTIVRRDYRPNPIHNTPRPRGSIFQSFMRNANDCFDF